MPAPLTGMWWLSIVLATAIAFIIGGIWYSPAVFGRQWMALNGFTDAELGKR